MMKRLSMTLIVLSFLFALAAVVIALTGTYALKGKADNLAMEVKEDLAKLDEETAAQPELPEGYELNTDQTPRAVSPEELGFTFLAPNEWGTFTLAHQPGMFVGGGNYAGAFGNVGIAYMSTIPEFMLSRDGSYGDLQGYRKTDDGYEINFLNQAWSAVPDRLVQGEVETKNGMVLIISLEETNEPSLFSGTKGERIAILNIPNGPVAGGVFLAKSDVERDAFRTFLESLEFVIAE